MMREDYQFKLIREDLKVLVDLTDILDKEIILQPFAELLPVVMIVDNSEQTIMYVLGQLNKTVDSMKEVKNTNDTDKVC